MGKNSSPRPLLQSNLLTTATLGGEESGRYGEVAFIWGGGGEGRGVILQFFKDYDIFFLARQYSNRPILRILFP